MTWGNLVVTATALLLCICSDFASSKTQLNEDAVQFWASSLGAQLNDRLQTASGIEDLKRFYDDSDSLRNRRIVSINGTDLVLTSANLIKDFLQIRYDAVYSIKSKAQELHFHLDLNNRTFDNGCTDYLYYNSKTLKLYKPQLDENITEPDPAYHLPIDPDWRRYYHVPVSLTASSIHVPTHIYNCSANILSNISWTEELDAVFMENHKKMLSSWQYFASSTGFLRFYPGTQWRYDGIDMYDARLTEWFTGAATVPKNIVILLDSSGSMTGLRMQIASKTVRKILETLQENDFFNVISFANKSVFVDSCPYSNGTLIQATAQNKRRIMEAIGKIKLGDMARFEKAFTLGFEVLLQANATKISGPNANYALMVITDGAPQGYKEVFEKYNWIKNDTKIEKWVRVFSYLIGEEVSDSNKKQVEWMACANKGYFYHIATMADVHDYVQDYVRVLARPLVVHNEKHHTWTGVHVNTPLVLESTIAHVSQSTQWIRVLGHITEPQLFISLAMPVYDLLPDQRKQGNLLGVAGVDINVEEIMQLIPRHMLGVQGYAFIINNNGFVISHPDFKPLVEPCKDDICMIAREGNPDLKINKPKPDYKNVDITYLEQEEDVSQGHVSRLKEAMINGSSGIIMARVKKFHGNQLRRVYIQTQTYYYSPIAGTPYSLAIVLVEPSDSKIVYSDMLPDVSAFDWCRLRAASWKYCDLPIEEFESKSPLSVLQSVIPTYKSNPACSDRHRLLLASVMYDAQMTRGIHAIWDRVQLKNKCSGPNSEQCELKRKLENLKNTLAFNLVVLGTRSGLTRYQERVDETSTSDAQICEINERFYEAAPSIDSEYFRRAAVARKGTWIFSVSAPAERFYNTSTLAVTASQGVYIKQHPEKSSRKQDFDDILVSVLGLKIQYDSLYRMFMMTTTICTDSMDCNRTSCDSEEVDCYLLDDNGYVIVSEDEQFIGHFFGKVDYQILLDLKEKDFFQEVYVTDYQALCTICRTTKNETSNSASIILNPFKYLSKIIWWSVTKIAIFLLEFSLHDWWNCIHYATASEIKAGPKAPPKPVKPVTKICNINQVSYIPNYLKQKYVSNLLKECVSCRITNKNVDQILNLNQSDIQIIDVGDPLNRTEICKITKVCDRSYVITRVPSTNLYLLVLEANCKCDAQMEEYCVEAHEISNHGCSESHLYRQAPIAHQMLHYNTSPYEDDPFYATILNPKASKKKPSTTWEEEERLPCGRSSNPSTAINIKLLFFTMIYFIFR